MCLNSGGSFGKSSKLVRGPLAIFLVGRTSVATLAVCRLVVELATTENDWELVV